MNQAQKWNTSFQNPGIFIEVNTLTLDKKGLVKSNFERDQKFNKNPAFLKDNIEKEDPVTRCMDVYKANIQSDGSLENLKLRIVVIVEVDLQNKETIGENWSPTESMRTLKYLLAGDSKHKPRVQQLDFIR